MIIPIIIILVAITIVFGPRLNTRTRLNTINLPEDIEGYLIEQEGRFSDITPGTEKKIIWADKTKKKTPYSIIYLHGFSATHRETAPLAENLAAKLKANLFLTRLRGHGRSGEAMVEGSVQAWAKDAQEALEIGKRIGEKVIILGVSTGGTLATWMAAEIDDDQAAAYILLSPNLGPRNKQANLLAWPWAKYWLPLIAGKERGFTPISEDHQRYWTSKYPTEALFPMMGLVKLAQKSDLENIAKPVLLIYSPEDQVLNPKFVEDAFNRILSENKKIIPVLESGDSEMHVIAGDIKSPETTAVIEKYISDFIKELARTSHTKKREA